MNSVTLKYIKNTVSHAHRKQQRLQLCQNIRLRLIQL